MRGTKKVLKNKITAFTLAEMMVVMLIVSIVLAAMAPVMTTKNKVDNSSPWRYSPANSSDAYFGAGEAMRAFIGQVNGEDADLGKLIINNNATGNSHILFKSNNDVLGDLYFNGTSLILGSRPSNSTNATYGANNISIGPNNWSSTGVEGDSNITIGDNAMNSLTTGRSNIGIGTTLNALTTGSNNVAVGDNSLKNSNGSFNVAVGANAYQQGTGGSNVIVGGDAMSKYSGNNNVVMGTQAMYYGSGNNNVAIGTNANYNGTNSEATYEGTTAVGHNAQASAEDAVAIGKNANSSREQAISINGTASGYSSIAMGTDSSTDGSYGVAIGNSAHTEKNYSVAIALDSTATGYMSIAIGNNSTASDYSSLAIGSFAKANGRKNIVIGLEAQAAGSESVAIGSSAQAAGSESVAIGSNTNANGTRNTAIGTNACKFVNGSNKTCIGANSGPDSSAAVGQGYEKTIFLGDADTTVYIPGNLVVGKRAFIGASLGDSGTKRNCLFYNTERGWHGVYGYKGSGDRDSWGFNMDDMINGRMWNDFRLGFTLKNYISDRRLKYVGTNNNDGLDKIKQLKVFNYVYKKDTTKTPHVGVIAQDLQKVFPNAVKKGADGFLTIRMEDMFYAVINAIKELDAKVSALQKENQELRQLVKQVQEDNKRLDERLKKLEAKK